MSIRRGTILLVDDEEYIRYILYDYLSELCYNVISACNGDEAVVVVDGPAAIDLIITDIIMPGFTDGLSLIKHVRRVRPKTRTIAMSGFAGSYSESIGIVDKFMSKPFTFLALKREIDALIN